MSSRVYRAAFAVYSSGTEKQIMGDHIMQKDFDAALGAIQPVDRSLAEIGRAHV